MKKSTGFQLKNINIQKQISLISLVTFIGLCIIGAAYMNGQSKIDRINKELETASQKLRLVEEINYEFLNSRRSEKDFLIRRDTKYAEKHNINAELIHETIQKLSPLLQKQDQITLLQDVKKDYGAYKTQFALVVKNLQERGLTHKEGLEGNLRQAVHAVESKIQEYNEPQLNVVMLMMRRHEKDFMLRMDPKYIKSMDDRLSEFQSALRNSAISFEDKKHILELMDKYQQSFLSLTKLELQNVEEIKKLSALFAETVPKLDAFSQKVIKDYNTYHSQNIEITKQTYISIIITIISVTIISLGLSMFIGRQISKPIVALSQCLNELGQGNLNTNVPGQDRGDEIGEMAASTHILRENSREARRLEREQQQEQQKQLDRAQTLDELTTDFEANVNELVNTLSSASTELSTTAQSMSSMAEQTTNESNSLTLASESTVQNIQTVASASEELSASIRDLSQQVTKTSSDTNAAAEDVDKASKQIEGLLEASVKIGDVVNLIQDIAEQTNLLALNATIESARAGEAGKGFSVVANEVKSLAKETSDATEQIAAEVQTVQGEIRSAVDAIKGIEVKINEVNTTATTIAAAIEEQNAATEEITRNTHTSARNMEGLDSNVKGMGEAAQVTSRSAQDVLSASQDLSHQANSLQQRVIEFIQAVKAA